MRRIKMTGLTALVAAASLLAAGCTNTIGDDSAADGKKKVTIAVYPWIGYEADVAVVSTILKKKLGYRVETKKIGAKDSWPALENGEVDILLENWGREADKKTYIEDKKIAVNVGETGNRGVIGWYVPMWMAQEYPDILDWRNLNKYAHLFQTGDSGGKGQLLEGDKSYLTNDSAIIANLGLNYAVNYSGSEQATVDAAMAAARDRKPLLFYFWEPHWVFQKFRFAKINLPEYEPGCDAVPEKVACDYVVYDLDKVVSKRFADTGGKAYQFIKNFAWTNSDQNEVADYLANEHLSYEDAAERWMEAHPDDWEPWLAF